MVFPTLDDPYPPSLPIMDSPDMILYRPSSTGPMDNFFGEQYDDVPSNHLDQTEAGHGFPEASSSSPDAGYDSVIQPFDSGAYNSQSSGSSPTSSPSSSIQPQRHQSSNSSRSAPATDEELNRQMNELFDFESAANSPGGSALKQKSPEKTIRGMAIPQHEASPQESGRQLIQSKSQIGPPASRSAVSTPSSFKLEYPWQHHHTQTQPYEFQAPPAFQNNYVHYQPYSMTTAPPLAASAGFVSPNNFNNHPPSLIIPSPAAFHGPAQPEQLATPKLTIEPISSKTRVETQIPVKMTLDPLPLGITKLHLPARTMAKSKLIAKPRPSPSSDMLELDVMPVCASAMRKPGVWRQALAMARGETVSAPSKQQKQRSSSEGPQENVDATAKIEPRDGGPINICDGCVMRERKRANRRIVKEETAEDIMWKQGEKDRIVVFNETEIVEWKPFGSIDLNESAGKRGKGSGKGKKREESGEDVPKPTFTPGSGMPYRDRTKQIRLQMRITCYCRHQGEPEGFQVIFTLKNHLGYCVAQGMSSPILITDDHKTSSPQNDGSTPEWTDGSHPPSAPYWPPAAPSPSAAYWPPAAPAPSNAGAATHLPNPGQSRSTSELSSYGYHHNPPALHRPSTSISLQQHGQRAAARNTGVSTPLRNSSYRTSATLTPRNLSRPVSPSATSGPTAKRRKASGSLYRPLPDLSMTRMSHHEQRPSLTPSSSSDASEGLTMANSEPQTAVSASRGSGTQSPRPLQPFLNGDMNAQAQALHAQALTHSLLPLAGAMVPPVVAPRVLSTIPREGPISGGIEICIRGEGFFNGLDVFFADAPASNTVVQDSSVIFCTIPPSSEAGRVQVTLSGHLQSERAVWFVYKDTDEKDLMSLALQLFHYRKTGASALPRDVALDILRGRQVNGHQGSSNGNQHHQQQSHNALGLETSILGLIDLVDQADSSVAPLYDTCQSNGQTMLHISASLGFRRLAAGLLARGANPNCRDRNGMSAVHMACLRGHPAVLRMLLSAGGDPTIRSLLGQAPIDMAMTQEVYQLISSIENHKRSRSLGATPASYLSRTNSPSSIRSATATRFSEHINVRDIDLATNNALVEAYRTRPATPAQVWARSRRNSTAEQHPRLLRDSSGHPASNTDNHVVTAAEAMAAWRDNLAGQIHYFHQSVQRTLPNLQVPTLPPLPTFEAYQEHPMVRRISSLVPRMNAAAAPAPPSYDEIYPGPSPADLKTASTARALGDAIMDSKCAAAFDNSSDSLQLTHDRPAMIRAIAEASTKEQHEQLRLAHTRNVKKLSHDRKLFFIWIPLLILVVIAWAKDWAPWVRETVAFVQGRMAAA